MNSLDALRKMVDHYPGGRAAVAARLSKTEEVLRKELSGATSHKLGVVDAGTIADMCIDAKSEHCHAYATSVAGGCGGFIALEVRDLMTTGGMRSEMARLLKEVSDSILAITESLSDEHISDNDRTRIERELGELFDSAQCLLRGTRAHHAAGKPAHLRAAA